MKWLEKHLGRSRLRMALRYYKNYMRAKKIQNPEGWAFIRGCFAGGAQVAANDFAANLFAWFAEGEKVEERFYYLAIAMDRKTRQTQVSIPPKQWTRAGFMMFVQNAMQNLHDGFFLTPEEEQALAGKK